MSNFTSLEEIRSYYSPEMRAELEARDEIERQWRKRRKRRIVAVLVLAVSVYVAAVVTTWMVGDSVAGLIILPLYAIGLAIFYGPYGWSIQTRSSSRKSTIEQIGGK